ncbi:hypothetical protein Cni_G06585 [Canna indica]|uniref:Uncharacterized protein n=1 Tax=Canna indica TaxID=4628 RepID=A0AAQ3JZK2_9LILI|nr:hypothetical protein Cni_G06585 [Canna indica]
MDNFISSATIVDFKSRFEAYNRLQGATVAFGEKLPIPEIVALDGDPEVPCTPDGPRSLRLGPRCRFQVSVGKGLITSHALMSLEARGALFVSPGMECFLLQLINSSQAEKLTSFSSSMIKATVEDLETYASQQWEVYFFILFLAPLRLLAFSVSYCLIG